MSSTLAVEVVHLFVRQANARDVHDWDRMTRSLERWWANGGSCADWLDHNRREPTEASVRFGWQVCHNARAT